MNWSPLQFQRATGAVETAGPMEIGGIGRLRRLLLDDFHRPLEHLRRPHSSHSPDDESIILSQLEITKHNFYVTPDTTFTLTHEVWDHNAVCPVHGVGMVTVRVIDNDGGGGGGSGGGGGGGSGGGGEPTTTEEERAVFTLNFAHFANGDGITSDLVFVNPGSIPIRPAVYFYDTEGNPIAAESVVDITGDLAVQEDGGLTVLTDMEPLGELTIATHGRGDLVTGSVKVIPDGPIGGVLRYNVPEVGAAGVGASPPTVDVLFPVRRQEGGINTGVAIHNLGAEAIAVDCRLMRGGVVLETSEIALAANGQASFFIDANFPGADTSDFAGAVRCDAPATFSAVALELDAVNRIFTTLPVLSADRRSGGRAAVLDFAHFANGGGITSDLVFVNRKTQPSGPALTPFHSAIPPIRPAVYFYDTEGNPIAAETVVDITNLVAWIIPKDALSSCFSTPGIT